MASVNLENLLEEVRALNAEERRQVQKLLDAMAESDELQSRRRETERKLIEAGLIIEVRQPPTDMESYRNYKPAEVTGRPVSETLIEERR
ncbi:MAG: hypothetical protein AB1631_25790 [Acidobacteriota bacterium]